MTILDRFVPPHLAAYWGRINASKKQADRTGKAVRKVAKQTNRLLTENHLGERLVLAFELKE